LSSVYFSFFRNSRFHVPFISHSLIVSLRKCACFFVVYHCLWFIMTCNEFEYHWNLNNYVLLLLFSIFRILRLLQSNQQDCFSGKHKSIYQLYSL
jgi:hypothetical protein